MSPEGGADAHGMNVCELSHHKEASEAFAVHALHECMCGCVSGRRHYEWVSHDMDRQALNLQIWNQLQSAACLATLQAVLSQHTSTRPQ